MPYKFQTEHTKLPRRLDRRVKITDLEKRDLADRHGKGEGIRELARAYPHISRRSIQFTLFPERKEKVAQQAKDRQQHKKTYERTRGELHRTTMREHNQYKQKALTDLRKSALEGKGL